MVSGFKSQLLVAVSFTCSVSLFTGKQFVAKKKSGIPEHEQVILEPELEEALKNATDAEMCDIAGWSGIRGNFINIVSNCFWRVKILKLD